MTNHELAEKTNEELLAEYQRTKELSIKQELVLRYIYLVKNIAIQFRNVYASFAQMDDIINEGIIALMAAVDKYDAEKNAKFETFVSKRLKGLIIDLARKNDWVPRNVRKESKEIDEAMKTLYETLGRYPTNQEIADFMHISLEKYLKNLSKTNLYNVVSLDYLIAEKMGEQVSDPVSNGESSPESQLEKKEQSRILQEGLATLREKEQIVLSLYYRKELTMKEIAEVLDLSEPRISQIHASALRSLKLYLEKNFYS